MDQEIIEKTKTLAISGDQNVPSSRSSNPSSSRTAAASINLNPDYASLVVPRRRSGLPPRPPPSPATRDRKNSVNWSRRSSNWLVDSCQIGSNWRGPQLSADSSQSGPDRRGSKISKELDRRGGRRSAGSSQVKLLPDKIVKKIVNQVEFYFSDINLVTTELLRKFINIDRDGFVPISVVASFKKIKDLVTKYSHNKNSVTKHLLAYALQSSSQLVVSKNGQKVRRKHGINDLYMKELQSRIIVAEDFPAPMARYAALMNFFSTAGRVKSIRTCYPPTDPVIAKISEKPGIHLRSKLHAFVEYETTEGAQKAAADLNENSESGIKVSLFLEVMLKQGAGQESKERQEVDGNKETDVSMSDKPNLEQVEHPELLPEASDVPAE